ncbi:MAG: polysaccharide biosynthesis C-terminal domain-containing protein [Actinobacteria bacterium]|nr:polysaccharide biosynthesis C-terminal domain-containing protein [Actinomycetota bacterium]
MTDTELDWGVGSGLKRDTALVTLCTLVSRVSGFGRVIATAAVLGSGLLGDVYQSANLIPNLLFELVAGGVLQAVLVPTFVAARRAGGRRQLGEAVQAANGVVLAALTSIAMIAMVASPFLTRLMVAYEPAVDVARDKLDLMLPMALVFVPQLVCYGLATVTSAALNARGRFVAAALAPAVNNVIVIAACLAFRASRDGEVADLDLTPMQFAIIAGGTTLGVVAYALTPATVLRSDGVKWWPRWHPEHTAVQAMRASFGWATLSVVGTLVPTMVALALGNGATGGVAVFVYAFAFYVLPHALVAVPMATTLAPRVADQWQMGDVSTARASIDSAMRIAVPLLVLAGAGMVSLSWSVARVAAFGQTASQGLAPIAHTLAAFGPGLVGYGVAFVMTRVLFAIGDVRAASVLMIVGAVVGVTWMGVASGLMAPTERAAALAMGYGASQTIAAVLLVRRVHRQTGSMSGTVTLRLLAESLVAGAASLATMVWVTNRFGTSRREALEAVLFAGVAGVFVFGAVMALLRGRELLGRRGEPAS